MIVLTVVLLLLSFLQSTILPLNFILLILISRSFVIDERENLYLAFFFGLLLSILLGYPLGSLSLVYLLIVLATKFIKKTQIADSWLAILPLSVIFVLFDMGAKSLILKSSLSLSNSVPEILLIIPIYFLIRFWEERFIIKPEIRLKVGR